MRNTARTLLCTLYSSSTIYAQYPKDRHTLSQASASTVEAQGYLGRRRIRPNENNFSIKITLLLIVRNFGRRGYTNLIYEKENVKPCWISLHGQEALPRLHSTEMRSSLVLLFSPPPPPPLSSISQCAFSLLFPSLPFRLLPTKEDEKKTIIFVLHPTTTTGRKMSTSWKSAKAWHQSVLFRFASDSRFIKGKKL